MKTVTSRYGNRSHRPILRMLTDWVRCVRTPRGMQIVLEKVDKSRS